MRRAGPDHASGEGTASQAHQAYAVPPAESTKPRGSRRQRNVSSPRCAVPCVLGRSWAAAHGVRTARECASGTSQHDPVEAQRRDCCGTSRVGLEAGISYGAAPAAVLGSACIGACNSHSLSAVRSAQAAFCRGWACQVPVPMWEVQASRFSPGADVGWVSLVEHAPVVSPVSVQMWNGVPVLNANTASVSRICADTCVVVLRRSAEG